MDAFLIFCGRGALRGLEAIFVYFEGFFVFNYGDFNSIQYKLR
jgi:hypothetical protein